MRSLAYREFIYMVYADANLMFALSLHACKFVAKKLVCNGFATDLRRTASRPLPHLPRSLPCVQTRSLHACKSVQIVAKLEFVRGFAIDLQTRKPNISPRVTFKLCS